jgi:hypothetical protein
MREESLELQSDRIEMVMASHNVPARVTGGVVTPRGPVLPRSGIGHQDRGRCCAV